MTVDRIPDETLIEDVPWPKGFGGRIVRYCKTYNIKTAGELRAAQSRKGISWEPNCGERTSKALAETLDPGPGAAVVLKRLVEDLDRLITAYRQRIS